MTDIYLNQINRRKSKTGCLFLSVLALLVVLVAAYFLLKSRDDTPDWLPDLAGMPAQTVSDEAKPRDAQRTASDQASSTTARTPAGDQGAAWLRDALEHQQSDVFEEARALGWRILDESKDQRARRGAEQMLNEIHTLLAFSRRPMAEKMDYVIQRGDSLARIASRHGTTVELLRAGNDIRGDLIRVGDRLRILQGTFEVTVNKTTNDLLVTLNDRFFKRYRVGTGEFGTTPVGEYKIVERIPRPVWWIDGRQIPYGHPDNLLGTHYLKLDVPGYGIHGTWEPESIGFQSSAGCVRMLNDEVEELFALLPVGVRVIIVE